MNQDNVVTANITNKKSRLNLNFNSGSKVLLIYPTLYRITGLPIGIASLSASLKDKGFDVKIFDTAFYKEKGRYSNQEKSRVTSQMTKQIDKQENYWKDKSNDLLFDLNDLLNKFNPSIVGISILENTKEQSFKMTRFIKSKYPNLPVVAGGIFPTLTPKIFVDEPSIDYICIGEGEVSFPDLCERIIRGKDCSNTRGFWIKKNGTVHKNPSAMLPDVNNIPYPDFGAFDNGLLHKPMQGRMYKMLSIEASRGCVHKCTYCENSVLGDFYNESGAGRYYRKMDMPRIIDQIKYQVKKYACDYIYLSSEYFLALSKADFDYFIKEYSKIKLPFYFQTRFETIRGDRLKALKEVGMNWLSVALEHGNENFRRKHLKRRYRNDMVVKSIEILKEHNIGASIQNMMGFPFENRDLIFETINFCKKLYRIHSQLQFNIYMFTPYRSCSMYKTCKEEGLLPENDEDYINGYAFDGNTALRFSPEYKKELSGLYRTFNLYVKLPDKYLPQIKIAEKDDDEGKQMLKELSKKITWHTSFETGAEC